MPGPFPGMDPYLEDPALWPSVHSGLIYLLTEELNRLLPSEFVASNNEWLLVVEEGRESAIYPDALVLKRPVTPPLPGKSLAGSAAVQDPPFVLSLPPNEGIRQGFIEILAVSKPGRVVTVIEILSHSNKAAGMGRKDYLEKQQEVLESDTHLLEIDLLRHGQYTVAPPEARVRETAGRFDYILALHRSNHLRRYEFWTRGIRDFLPHTVLIPLTDDVPDVVVDLQAVFDRCYDGSAFGKRADYTGQPYYPLQGEDAAWADALLREKGLRSGGETNL